MKVLKMRAVISLLAIVGFASSADSTSIREELDDKLYVANAGIINITDKIMDIATAAGDDFTNMRKNLVDMVLEVASGITNGKKDLVPDTGIVTNNNKVKIADEDFLAKQKFLFEIVYRVDDPLTFEDLRKLGKAINLNKTDYIIFDEVMEKFYEAYNYGALLPKGEFFGALVETHLQQAIGLFNLFYYAKTFEVFQRKVAWARMNCNEGMFVYALVLAVNCRNDCRDLILPSIYEIFPQNFFNSEFINKAQRFNYDVWTKSIMYEKEYQEILYKNYKNHNNPQNFFTKDWKMWQWWKLMGLGEQWYSEDRFMLRENMNEYYKDTKHVQMLEDTKMFFIPVDYTREIDFYNKESALSYFTEDVSLNAYWYYLNINYAFFLDGKILNRKHRGEYWLHVLNLLLVRYRMERLSHGYSEIPEFSLMDNNEDRYHPQLIYHNGVGFSNRENYGKQEKIQEFFNRFNEILINGFYNASDGKTIDLRKPESIEYIGNILQGNVDANDKSLFKYWYMIAHMNLADVDTTDYEVFPNTILNFETMMRDPAYYAFIKNIVSFYFNFYSHLKPHTHEELMFPGVAIKNVTVSKLVTYFDLADIDVTNLLKEKMNFVKGKFVWDKTLLACQMRLNHKPFNFKFTIESDKKQKAIIRIFLGPKYDEFGRVIPLTKNRLNFMDFETIIYNLEPGINVFNYSSNDFHYITKDRISYTEVYKRVILALEGKYDFPLNISEPQCGFPGRLTLPRGWPKGMPMQFFFHISPYIASNEPSSAYNYICGIGADASYFDDKRFGYPFERKIDELEFFGPNMLFKNVKIYHEETFEKYQEQSYENFGHFDYSYNN